MSAPQSSAPKKYVFDLEFADDGSVIRQREVSRTRFSRDEVEAARQAGFEAGRQAEEARALRAAAAACEEVLKRLQPAPGLMKAESERLRADAAELALAIGRALAGAALERFGEAQIMAAIEECLSHLSAEPRVILRAAPRYAPALEAHFAPLVKDMGWADRLIVRADPTAQPGDWSVEWSAGQQGFRGAEANMAIAQALSTHLAEPARSPEAGEA